MQRTEKILECLNAGDLACAFSNGESLARTCSQISILEPDLAPAAQRVIDRIDSDFDAAALRWLALARSLRNRAIEQRLRSS